MAAKFIVLFACVALAAGGLVKREAADDFSKHAKELQETFSKQINELVNSKDSKELSKTLKDGTDKLLQDMSTFSASIQNAIKDASGKAKETLEKSKAEIQKTVEDLRKQNPEIEKNAEKLRQSMQTAVNSVFTESQKIAKAVANNVEETNKKLAPQIKSAYDDFVKNAGEVQKKISDAANKKQ